MGLRMCSIFLGNNLLCFKEFIIRGKFKILIEKIRFRVSSLVFNGK